MGIPEGPAGSARQLDLTVVRRLVTAALDEDLGARGDVTTAALFRGPRRSAGHLVAREDLVLAGCEVAREVFLARDASLMFRAERIDGERIRPGERVATVVGDARPILEGERTALNFLMRMCGIATAAGHAVAEVAGTGCRILDTRKTAPGLRYLDKYAVACGGATNHRMGLYDAVMIKDTHLDSGCTMSEAVRRALERGHPAESITVEVRDLEQLEQAVASGAGRALLDNMSVDALRRAVESARGRIVLEASGGLRPGTLRAVADTGVDFASLGWLTHSSRAANLAMEMESLG
jgi:nicotinate-nucleotide pyrophosphorylase (carboxylating)